MGHTLRHSEKGAYGADFQAPDNAKDAYEAALNAEQLKTSTNAPASVAEQMRTQRQQKNDDMPPYVPSQRSVEWKQQYNFDKEQKVSDPNL